MTVNQEQMLNNLGNKIAKLKKEYGNEDGAKELINLYEDYKENGISSQELSLYWEDVNNYLYAETGY